MKKKTHLSLGVLDAAAGSVGLGDAFTPGFWDKAEVRAMETLGTLSPGSRWKVDAMAKSAAAGGIPASVRDAPNCAPPSGKRKSRLEVAGPSEHTGTGVSIGLTGLTVPSPSATLHDMPSVRSDPKSPGSGRLRRASANGGGAAKGDAGGTKRRSDNHNLGDLASAVGAGPLKKGRRPPKLTLSDTAGADVSNLEAGTPLLSGGGAVVGEVPGLRASARGGAGQSLRKAVLEKWAAPTPTEGGAQAPTPATTGATPCAAMDPLAFLMTPRDEGGLTPSGLLGKGDATSPQGRTPRTSRRKK